MTRQRDLFGRKGRLNRERVALLEAFIPGWSWDPSADDWEEGFRHLAAFVKQEGRAQGIPQKHREGGLPPGGLGNTATWPAQARGAKSRTSDRASGSSPRMVLEPGG